MLSVHCPGDGVIALLLQAVRGLVMMIVPLPSTKVAPRETQHDGVTFCKSSNSSLLIDPRVSHGSKVALPLLLLLHYGVRAPAGGETLLYS